MKKKLLKSLSLLVNVDSGAQDGRSDTGHQASAADGMRDDGAQTRQWWWKRKRWVDMPTAFSDLSPRPSYPTGQ